MVLRIGDHVRFQSSATPSKTRFPNLNVTNVGNRLVLVLLGDRDDAVPVVGGGAVVLGDEDGQEVFYAVFGRDVVQKREGQRPIQREQGIECRFIGRDILVTQLRILVGGRQQLTDLQRFVEPVRSQSRYAADARDAWRDTLANLAGRRFIDQDRSRSSLVKFSRRAAKLTTGPNTVTFTWSTVPILPATAGPVAIPMPTRKSANGWSSSALAAANSARTASAARHAAG